MSNVSAAALTSAATRELAKRSLEHFTRYIDPNYLYPPHLKLLDEYLSKVECGEITRLMVFMPPRHGKSEKVSRKFPLWYLGRNPEHEIILASYGASLAERHTQYMRNVLQNTPAFKDIFGLELDKNNSTKEFWGLKGHRGSIKAVGVGGPVVGMGGDLIIIDDPVKNRAEAESSTIQRRIQDWFAADIYTRLAPGAKIVLMHTRWHPRDLAGWILSEKKGDWVVLNLPAISEQNDMLGRGYGEALWPERYSIETLKEIYGTLGGYDFQALYQQNPRMPGGALVKRENFRIIKSHYIKDLQFQVRAWDLATSKKQTADSTVGTKYGYRTEEDRYCVANVHRFKEEWPVAKEKIKDTAFSDGVYVPLFVEVSAFQTAVFQELKAELTPLGYTVLPFRPDVDKKTRFLPFATQVNSQKVDIIEADWNNDWLSELCDFSGAATDKDDQVDSVSAAHYYLMRETILGGEFAI